MKEQEPTMVECRELLETTRELVTSINRKEYNQIMKVYIEAVKRLEQEQLEKIRNDKEYGKIMSDILRG